MQGLQSMSDAMIEDMERAEMRKGPRKGMDESLMKNMDKPSKGKDSMKGMKMAKMDKGAMKNMDPSITMNMASSPNPDPFYAAGGGRGWKIPVLCRFEGANAALRTPRGDAGNRASFDRQHGALYLVH